MSCRLRAHLPVLITLTIGEDNVRELSHHTLGTIGHEREAPVIIWLLEAMAVCKPLAGGRSGE